MEFSFLVRLKVITPCCNTGPECSPLGAGATITSYHRNKVKLCSKSIQSDTNFIAETKLCEL